MTTTRIQPSFALLGNEYIDLFLKGEEQISQDSRDAITTALNSLQNLAPSIKETEIQSLAKTIVEKLEEIKKDVSIKQNNNIQERKYAISELDNEVDLFIKKIRDSYPKTKQQHLHNLWVALINRARLMINSGSFNKDGRNPYIFNPGIAKDMDRQQVNQSSNATQYARTFNEKLTAKINTLTNDLNRQITAAEIQGDSKAERKDELSRQVSTAETQGDSKTESKAEVKTATVDKKLDLDAVKKFYNENKPAYVDSYKSVDNGLVVNVFEEEKKAATAEPRKITPIKVMPNRIECRTLTENVIRTILDAAKAGAETKGITRTLNLDLNNRDGFSTKDLMLFVKTYEKYKHEYRSIKLNERLTKLYEHQRQEELKQDPDDSNRTGFGLGGQRRP